MKCPELLTVYQKFKISDENSIQFDLVQPNAFNDPYVCGWDIGPVETIFVDLVAIRVVKILV